MKPVHGLALFRRRQDGQALGLGGDRLPVGRPDPNDVEDQDGGVVARPRLGDLVQNGLGVGVGRSTPCQQPRQGGLVQHPVHPVRGQHQPVVRLQLHMAHVQLHVRLDADGAVQHMAQPLLGPGVILSQPGQHPVAEMPGPTVPHMKRHRLTSP